MKYIISGGGFGNNGAESMRYTVISNIRNREPDAKLMLKIKKFFTRRGK